MLKSSSQILKSFIEAAQKLYYKVMESYAKLLKEIQGIWGTGIVNPF